MEEQKLAKGTDGRLLYFGSWKNSLDDLGNISSKKVRRSCEIFFRAKNKKIITDTVVAIPTTIKNCVDNTPLKKIPTGKEVKFIAGDPMEFKGTAMGVVNIEGYEHLQIEIIHGKLYFYSWIDPFTKKCKLLRVVS